MARLLRSFVRGVTGDLRHQFACPTKSMVGWVCTRVWENQNKRLIERVVERANLNPDSRVLEIGHGRGYGIGLCHEIVQNGDGCVFGLEASPYMSEKVSNHFAIESEEEKSVVLDRVPVLLSLPYPTDLLDAVYHVDTFYFWSPKMMQDICREVYRILKPGAPFICGMELDKLRRFEKYGIVREDQFDPMRYMIDLEPAGFDDVKIEYEKLTPKREIQIITARKPELTAETYDPEALLKRIEMQVKQDLAIESLMKSQQHNSELVKEASQKLDVEPEGGPKSLDESQESKSRTSGNQ